MPNYIIIDSGSNLIVKVITSSIHLLASYKYRAIRVSDAILAKYYRLANIKSRRGTAVDIGELAKVSPALFEILQSNR